MIPLDPDPNDRARWTTQAVDFLNRELDQLREAPAMGPSTTPGPLPGIPSEGIAFDEALELIREAASYGLNPAVPGYLAYIPGGGIYASALASFLSLSLNRFVGLNAAAPGMVRFEREVIELFASELGMPLGSGGILTSGGSMANLCAIVAARTAAFGDTGDFSRATLYLSKQAHISMSKSARIAGIPEANVRWIDVDERFRMMPAGLEAAIAGDRAAGYRPFLVSAAAGTTNTGAIDPLEVIGGICRREGLWFHVDGAYGGMFVLTHQGKSALKGIEQADSTTLDPHKGLFLPYGCGALVVRDESTLLAAFTSSASYLQDLVDGRSEPSLSELGPELSRNDRGLLVWLPLVLHGLSAFRNALREKLELARSFREALRALPIEVPVEPDLSIVAFRLARLPDESLEAWNERNRTWLARVNSRRQIVLSSTMLPVTGGDAFTLRVCILSFRTDAAAMEMAMQELAESL